MATPIDAEFFERLAELNDKFAASLPADAGTPAGCARRLRPGRAARRRWSRELHAVLHTLAGSAATFGFRTLGQQARMLEQRLRVLHDLRRRSRRETGKPGWPSWTCSWPGRCAIRRRLSE